MCFFFVHNFIFVSEARLFMATRTVGAALDELLNTEERSILHAVQSGDPDTWAGVAAMLVSEVCDAAGAKFSGRLSILVEALLLKVSRANPSTTRRRYQANLRGTGAFPLEKMYDSLRAATTAVCAALNDDLERLVRETDTDTDSSLLLLPALCGLIDDWRLESDWRTRLANASLLPDTADGLDASIPGAWDSAWDGASDPSLPCVVGRFVVCPDGMTIRFGDSDDAAPCVTVLPFDPTVSESVRYAVDVAPRPRGRPPKWLLESHSSAFKPKSPAAAVETFIFETPAAAFRARSYFCLRSLVASDVYTVDK
jgi:hypothetical protein